MKEKKRESVPDELTEAMHGEFTVDEETDYHHRINSARNCVAQGLLTPLEAADAYGFPLEELMAPLANLSKKA